MTKRREYWAVMQPVMPAEMLGQVARQMEEMGLSGVFQPNFFGVPWTALAAVAGSTSRMRLGSGVAIASAHSPVELAMTGIDLDRLSEGRFVLGIGTSVKPWVHGFFGLPYPQKPIGHLRETIEVIRLVTARLHTGTLREYHGRYFDLDFTGWPDHMEPVRTQIPIWVAALRSRMVRLGAEVGDGIIGHPIWSLNWITENVAPWVKEGLAVAGKSRDDIHIDLMLWVVPTNDADGLQDAKATVAFYAGLKQFESYFSAHGFEANARRLQEAARTSSPTEAAALVSEEMARTFVQVGTPDVLRERFEPLWDLADSLCFIPALAAPPERFLQYQQVIAESLYR